MGDLTAAEFDAYFQAVHGYEPYPWQSRLTREVLDEGEWPEVIELPTGTGKTAVLDTALFTLAARPEMFPRRIVFVIDRRIVVDQVYERAEKIRDTIRGASEGVVLEMQKRLKKLTDADEPLGVAALRGGIPIDGEWARRPEQPWVMVSTVDQFGSRLLFRGYGVSDGMRPLHAGLAGNDCLVILDEVHLSRAFADTLRDVSSNGDIPRVCSVSGGLPRRFETVEMSATPANEEVRRFELAREDLEASPMLKRIAEAPKRAKLVELRGTGPAHRTVPKKVLYLISNDLLDDETSIGVIVNRVRTARDTHAALRERGIAAHLLTGRMRPIDREGVLAEIKRCVDPDRSSPLAVRTVVVATQAIEVGADFSFDALITEAAPVDSLRQRLGRLDRRGTLAEKRGDAARCWILGVASALNPKKPDPVYDDAARVTWEELQRLAEGGEIEVGPRADLLKQLSDEALAPKPDAPLLLPAHIDAWSQTGPKPVVDPDIAEFLHGKERSQEPDVYVVWRLDRSASALALVPPRPVEFLPVPISAVRGWLRGTAEVPVADTALAVADEAKSGRDNETSAEGRVSRVVRWSRREDDPAQQLERVDQINPGDVIVADPMLGGLRHGTWDPRRRPHAEPGEVESDEGLTPIEDVGDQAQFAHGVRASRVDRGVRATLRLDARLLEGPEIPKVPSPDDEQEASRTTREAVELWLSELRELPSGVLPDWMSRVVEHFRSEDRFDVELVESEPRYYVLVGRSVDPAVLDKFDDDPSLTGTKTTLRDHLEGVGTKVADFGRRLGLPEDVVEDLRLAGELHDLGKVDSRFQAQLHGHDPVRIAESDEPLAKSLRGARTRKGEWPPVRHEISSVALAQSNPTVLDRAHDPDLVLHLVGSHHGYSRPLPPIKKDDESQKLNAVGQFRAEGFRIVNNDEPQVLEAANGLVPMSAFSDLSETSLALEMADRFWRLQERYGHHGLAWLEAILRLADHQQSAEEAQ